MACSVTKNNPGLGFRDLYFNSASVSIAPEVLPAAGSKGQLILTL